MFAPDARREFAQKIVRYFPIPKGRAADDYFFRAPRKNSLGVGHGPNPPTDAYFPVPSLAQQLDPSRV